MKSWPFEKIKTDKLSAKLIKRQRKKIQINKTIDETWDITKDMEKIQRFIRTYFTNLYSTKMKNSNKVDEFLDIHDREV